MTTEKATTTRLLRSVQAGLRMPLRSVSTAYPVIAACAARTTETRWMEMLWEGTNIAALEEARKEEVLAVFRELARDSGREREVRDYVPLELRW